MLLMLLACTELPLTTTEPAPFDAASVELIEPSALPELEGPPDLLTMWSTGEPITTSERWESHRKPEAQLLFGHYVYGESPESSSATIEDAEEIELSAGIVLTSITAELDGLPFTVSVFHSGALDQPVLLGLNKCGEHTLLDDPAVPEVITPSQAECDATRGSRATYWGIQEAIDAGWAVATVHQSAFALDEASAEPAWGVLSTEPWGAVGIWSFGLMRTLDVLEQLPEIDPERMALWGHSRRGKAALWAAAQDERVAGVWGHQSGTAGQTMSRSFNGEPVGAMNLLFPHWFPERFHAFGEREQALPIDQHVLLGMIAPRSVVLIDGSADTWADPEGVDWAIELATPAFDLYGATPPSHTVREGGHDVRVSDWQIALDSL